LLGNTFFKQSWRKWKVLLIYAISLNCNRFSLLKKGIPTISKQTSVNLLKEPEEDNIIECIVFHEYHHVLNIKLRHTDFRSFRSSK